MEAGEKGFFEIKGTNGFSGRFFYEEEYDRVTAQRTVSLTGIEIQSTSYGGTMYLGGTVSMDSRVLGEMTYINAVTHQVTAGMSEAWNEVSAIAQGKVFPWVSETIESNRDGSKTVTFQVDISFWRQGIASNPKIQGSAQVILAKVPRASAVSAAKTATMGGSLDITVTKAVESYTHDLNWEFEGQSGEIAKDADTGARWEIPLALAKLIPAAVSGEAKIVCKTFMDGTEIGQTAAVVTLTVPNDERTRPKVTLSVNPTSELPQKFSGLYIQGKTNVNAAIGATSAFSGVAKIATTAWGQTCEGIAVVFTPPGESGDLTVRTTVTDERGYETTAEHTIQVIPYSPPKVVPIAGYSKPVVERADFSGNAKPDGEWLAVRAGRSYSNVNGLNSCIMKARWYDAMYDPYGNWFLLLDTDGKDEYNASPGGPLDENKSYRVEVAVEDEITGMVVTVLPLSAAQVPLHLGEGGRNVGIGQYCDYSEPDRVDVGWKLWTNRGIGLRKLYEGTGVFQGNTFAAENAAHYSIFLAVIGGGPVLCARSGSEIRGVGMDEAGGQNGVRMTFDGANITLTTASGSMSALYALI